MSFLGFGSSYENAGSGIAKNAPKKNKFFRFFEGYFDRFWKMVRLSLLTFLFCIPVVTVGPAVAGMTKVLRSFVLDKDVFLFHEFMRGFKENWKKSLPVGIVDLIFLLSLFASLTVYPSMAEAAKASGGSSAGYTILCVISVGFALTIFMMNFYLFPMIVSTELPLSKAIKNSFYLTALELKTNIITLVIILLLSAFMLILTFLSNVFILLLIPFMLISFVGFLIMFNCYPVIQKYVIDPYYKERGQDNPEYDFLKPLDPDDAVFIDKGGEEAPIKIQKKNAKKVIK